MPNPLAMACLLLAWADPPATAPAAPTALEIVSALETTLADAIARAAPAVVAIARERSERDETLAIRGRNHEPPSTRSTPNGSRSTTARAWSSASRARS